MNKIYRTRKEKGLQIASPFRFYALLLLIGYDQTAL